MKNLRTFLFALMLISVLLQLFYVNGLKVNNKLKEDINTTNDVNRFTYEEKKVESAKCGTTSDCNECQMSGYNARCHESICYCCNNEKKCWCQK